MNPINITRASAQARSKIVTTASYRIHLDLSGRDLTDPETFVSTSTVQFSSTGEPTHIDIVADKVLSATLDGAELDLSGFNGATLPFQASAGEHELSVVALCRYSHTGEGLHKFVDPADDRVYLYTQHEAADARRTFANFEQPDLKATFQFTVTAPQHWVVISNATSVDPEPVGDDLGMWVFDPTLPMSTYLTAVVAGEYHVDRGTITTRKGQLPANILCRQSLVEHLDADRIRHTTQRGFDVFEEAFNYAYPFGSYDQSFVPEFNFGAMENAGCITHRDEYLFRSRVTAAAYEGRDNTILHELAHMWFGDLVTMKWWDDLWLNESFAEWASHFCMARIHAADGGSDPWVGFANARKTWAYLQDQLPTTHPIAADMVDLDAVEQNFDGITYAKGASTLKQLVSFVGEDAFLAGVRQYFKAHAFGNTELSDLLSALEEASGRDLSWFTGEWLEKAGVNTVRPELEVAEDGTFARASIVQTAHPDWPTLRTHRLAVGLFDLVDGRLVRRDSIELDISGERTAVDALVGATVPDLLLLNDRDLTYAKVRLDERSQTTAIEHIDALDDELARALVWASAWDMCRDAEMKPSDYVALVLKGVGRESDLTAVGALVRQATLAATHYTRPEAREESRRALVAGLAGLLKDAAPGSDHQLAFANGLIQNVFTEQGAELVRGWLEGEEVPEGLVVDSDMRWKIVTALARMGVFTEADIAAEQQRDQTIQGAEFAAGARAALPTKDAKEAAWARATEDASVPNGTHRTLAAQFWQLDQDDALAGFGERYLTLCERISAGEDGWPTRGHAITQSALTWLFPGDADEAFVQRVDAWLAENTPSDTVKRTVLERRDASARALRVQAIS